MQLFGIDAGVIGISVLGMSVIGVGAGLLVLLLAWLVRRRQPAATPAAKQGAGPEAEEEAPPPVPPSDCRPSAAAPADPVAHRLERRMDEIEAIQADLAERVAGLAEAGDGARVQAVARSLVGLIKAKNATLESALAGLDQLRARLAALETAEARPAEVPAGREASLGAEIGAGIGAEIAGALARAHAGKDTALDAVLGRLGALEARLAVLEARTETGAEAHIEAGAAVARTIAARTAFEETRRLATRLGLLEASLPRLSLAQSLLLQALERQALPNPASPGSANGAPVNPDFGPDPDPQPAPAADPVPPEDLAEDLAGVWRLPRVVSLHQGQRADPPRDRAKRALTPG